MANEIMKKEDTAVTTYGATANLGDLLAEEMDGLTPSFERIRIPAGGGIAFEVPGDNPENPDTVKEFKAVILYHLKHLLKSEPLCGETSVGVSFFMVIIRVKRA